MISILIAIGTYFYYRRLAVRNGKVGWQYGILGVIIWFVVQFAFMLAFGMAGIIADPNHYSQDIDFNTLSLVNILAWVLSLAILWLVYWYLNSRWKRS